MVISKVQFSVLIHIGQMGANVFGYADDIVILSPSCTALKSLIDICEKYGKEHNDQIQS